MQWNPIHPSTSILDGLELLGLGDSNLLARPNLALLSSARAPAGILLAIHDLAQHWRRHGPVIMSGFQSPVENEALAVLLRGPQPLVIWLARGPLTRLPDAYRQPLAKARLLLVSSFRTEIKRASEETAMQRNLLLAQAADALLVAHAEPDSKTATLAAALLSTGKAVYTLDHAANQNLLEMGAQVYTP